MRWKLTRRPLYFSLSIHIHSSLYLLVFMWFCSVLFTTRPRLLDFVSAMDEEAVKSVSQKAFQSLPDVSKAVSELTVLKGVGPGPATASAILAAYAPDLAPFMSDEAMEVALGNSKDYSLKQDSISVEKKTMTRRPTQGALAYG